MRRGDVLYFLPALGPPWPGRQGRQAQVSAGHLGSGSVILDDHGRWLADQRFWPYGETMRLDGASETGTLWVPTDRLFTGMGLHSYIKLYTMGARQYDPELGRWLSPDSIIPDPANPQSLNRYSYVIGNPLRYTDPTGHLSEDEIMEFFGLDPDKDTWEDVLAHFQEGGDMEGNWGFLAALRDFESLCTLEAWSDDAVIGTETYSEAGYSVDNLLALGKLGAASYSIYDPLLGQFGHTDPSIDPSAYKIWYDARTQYPLIGFAPRKVDWTDVGVNVIGIAGDVANAVPVYGQIAWGFSEVIEMWEVMRVAHSDDPVTVLVSAVAFSGGRLTPPPWGTVASCSSIVYDLSAGIYVTY